MFLKVAPMRGMLRFEKNEKLSPRIIGSFEILKRVGVVAYIIALPLNFPPYTMCSTCPYCESTLQTLFM